MLRLNRITPPGSNVASIVRKCGDSSVPSKPMIMSCPTCCRRLRLEREGIRYRSVTRRAREVQCAARFVLVDLLLQFVQQIERLERADGVEVRLLDAIDDLLRERCE